MSWYSCSKAISSGLIAASLMMQVVFADESSERVDTAVGKAVYSQTCIACHGADGKGAIPGVRDLSAVDGPLSKSDEKLVESITNGVVTPGAALTMPAKGGNPGLTLSEIKAVVAFLRDEFQQH